jgi:hypothetical protein
MIAADGAALEAVVFNECTFIHTPLPLQASDTFCLFCLDCVFNGGGNPDATGITAGPSGGMSVTNCLFEDLLIGIGGESTSFFPGAIRVCTSQFVSCGQAIVGFYRRLNLFLSTFIDIAHEVVYWQCRLEQIVIDGCSFADPLDGSSVTLSFAATDDSGSIVPDGTGIIANSCFRGAGRRIAWATAIDSIAIPIEVSVCFESDLPFGAEHANPVWNPTLGCSACPGIDLDADDLCGEALVPPLPLPTPSPIPDLPTFFRDPSASDQFAGSDELKASAEMGASEGLEASDGLEASEPFAGSDKLQSPIEASVSHFFTVFRNPASGLKGKIVWQALSFVFFMDA